MRVWLLAFIIVLVSQVSAARTVRFGLIVGNNSGHIGDVKLLYAERDAQRLFGVLRGIGGFDADKLVLMLGEDADKVHAILSALNRRIAAARRAQNTVLLLVYYSGHAADDGLHLAKSTLTLPILKALVTHSPANYRILILDSCRSGKLTRVKGARLAPPFKITIQDRLPGEGTVFITSSAANEDSQESDRLKASFFSHFFVSGLLGAADADGDGRITVNEVYHFTYHNTLRASSKTLAGIQRPTYRYRIKGKGDVVLTDLSLNREKRGQLRFRSAGHYLVFKGSDSGLLVAEVFVGKRALLLSVVPGRYLVRKREAATLREQTLTVRTAQTQTLDVEKMAQIAYARLVRKGSSVKSLAHGPMVHYTYRGSILPQMPGMHQAALSYYIALRWLSIATRVSYGRYKTRNEQVAHLTQEFGFETMVSRSFDIGRVSFHLGLHLGVSTLWQSFTTTGIAPPLRSVAFTFGGEGGLSVDIGGGVWARLSASLLSYVLRVQNAAGELKTNTPLTYRLGVGVGYLF